MPLNFLKKLKNFYVRNERKVNSAGLLTGFLVDMFIFQQTNLQQQVLVLFFYLTVAASGITLVNAYEGGRLRFQLLDKLRLWLPLIIQYAFGGLFAAFVILYIQSASLLTSWPFFAILATILVGNEFFRKHYLRLTFHTAIFFLAVFSFAVFYLPVVINRLGPEVFVAGSVISLVAIAAFLGFLSKIIPRRLQKAKDALIFTIGSIFIAMYVFYFANIIPPIPLAMKTGGAFHNVAKTAQGYQVSLEPQRWYEHFLPSQTVHIAPGQPVYVFASIFAPADMELKIQHHWQFFDPDKQKWLSKSKISYSIQGGRNLGYRGFSVKYNLEPGRWRVDVETARGQIIGRIPFTIEFTNNPPPLQTKIFYKPSRLEKFAKTGSLTYNENILEASPS